MRAVSGGLKRVYDVSETDLQREHLAGIRSQANMVATARQGIAGALGDIKKSQGGV